MSELINKYNLVLDNENKYIQEILNFYSKLKEHNEKNFRNALTCLVVLLVGGVFLLFILLYFNNFSCFF